MKMMSLRSLALQVVSAAIGNRPQRLSVSRLASWFGCSPTDVNVLCSSCGFTVSEDAVSISRPQFQQPQVPVCPFLNRLYFLPVFESLLLLN